MSPFATSALVAALPATNTAQQLQQECNDLEALKSEDTTMDEVDGRYECVRCLGHGGFGSVFLATKRRSGRQVAMKLFRIGLEDDDEEVHDLFTKEVDALLRLDGTDTQTGDEASKRNKHIVYFKDWFRGPNFACIVMEYCNGGTLADQIDNQNEPYTERRIALYAFQLCDALAHAHTCGVAHYDVKSSNILVNNAAGGRLYLADWGSSVFAEAPDCHQFTKLFAAPELLTASERDDFAGLQPEKIDSFGLGCILFELICNKRMVDFGGEETIGGYIRRRNNVDPALDLPHVSLPWLPGEEDGHPTSGQIGYSLALRNMINNLLQPDPSARWAPLQLLSPLRDDPKTPLLSPHCYSSHPLQHGDPVTIDNVQLGMFVQRGHNWDDGDSDGGPGSIGVVVELDVDGLYCWAAFPSTLVPLCCRIGADSKFELSVGPTHLPEFYRNFNGIRHKGIVYGEEVGEYYKGLILNESCTVVYVNHHRSMAMIAPLEKLHVLLGPAPQAFAPPLGLLRSRKPMPLPDSWNLDLGLYLAIEEGSEREMVFSNFFSDQGGFDMLHVDLVSIHAVQSKPLWDFYARQCEEVAMSNWASPNERRLWYGTRGASPEGIFRTHTPMREAVELVSSAVQADRSAFRVDGNGTKEVVLARVALGRTDTRSKYDNSSSPRASSPLVYHSKRVHMDVGEGFNVSQPSQIYPEFIVTYRSKPRFGRPAVHARRPRVTRTMRRVPPRPLARES